MKRRRGRSKTSLKRRRPKAIPRKSILVVCEGEKTEPQYFESLRNDLGLGSVEVKIMGRQCASDPISVVKFGSQYASERKNADIMDEFDEIWYVIDVENPPHPNLNSALQMANKSNGCFAFSNPCFEYWFILHFQKTASPMDNAKQCVKKLTQYMSHYTKSDKKVYENIKQFTSKAVTNAKQLIRDRYGGKTSPHSNPITTVYRLVTRLKAVAKMPKP